MDPNAPALEVPQQVNDVMAPGLIAVLLSSGLLGVLSVQVFLYYLAFPNDRLYMRCLVYGIYTLEVVRTALITEIGFRTFVTSFGDVQVFNGVETEWLSIPILTAICTFLVQGFYAHRIHILAQSKKVAAGVIIALSFIQLGGGIAVGVHTERRTYYTWHRDAKTVVFEWSIMAMWNVGSVLCDIIIAVCMTYYLSRYDSTIKQTKVILKKAILLTVQTGSLTAVIAIASFSLAVIPRYSIYYQVPMGIIGNVYANSMLVLINSRMVLSSEETQAPSMVISELRFGTAPANITESAIEAIEAEDGDLAVDTGAEAGPSGSSEPETV